MKTQSIYLVTVLLCFSFAVPVKEKARNKKIRNFVPQLKQSCKMTLCNETEKYPVKAIRRLVKHKKNLQLFSKVSLIEPTDEFSIPDMATREHIEKNNLCRTRTVNVLPKAGLDLQSGEHRFIININNYVQTVVYETCVEPNQSCIDPKMFPFGFRTTCVQKYNNVRLVSLTKSGYMEYGKFMVPSTCVCSYIKDDSMFKLQ